MQPLSKEEFRDALRKGLGRAILHVKDYGADGLMDDILHAVTHNLVFDPQMNGNRYEWILWLIKKTRRVEFFRERVLEALRESREPWDLSLLYALAAEFAEGGDEEARTAIYEKFERQEVDEPWLGGTSLVCLYGMEGFMHVAKLIGARMRRDPAYRERLRKSGENDYMIYIAADTEEKKNEALALLRERADADEAIRIYLEEFETYLCREESRSSPPGQPGQLSMEDVLACIERLEWTRRYQAKRCYNRVAPEGHNDIFKAMLAETRREQLLQFFWFYSGKPLPWFDEKLLEWAASEDTEIRSRSLMSLTRLEHPSIRKFALEQLRQPGTKLIPNLIRLFAHNWRPGDAELIRSALWVPENPNTAHEFVLDILNLSSTIKNAEMRDLWLWAYEHSPCAYCRSSMVEHLIEFDLAPYDLQVECRFDCEEETRERALEALKKAKANQ